jgi:hypothetical protein
LQTIAAGAAQPPTEVRTGLSPPRRSVCPGVWWTAHINGESKKEANETFFVNLFTPRQQCAVHQESRHRHDPE